MTYVGEISNTNLIQTLGESLCDQDVEMVTFINVATYQNMVIKPEEFYSFPKGLVYFQDPEAYDYGTGWPMLNGQVFIAAGLRKSTKIVNFDSPCSFSIAVSPKLALFHHDIVLTKKLLHVWPNHQAAESLIKGLYVCPLHLLHREQNPRVLIFRVTGLGSPANLAQFEYMGQKVTVADYFSRVHNINLVEPDLPVVICTRNDRETFYPLEVCGIWQNQRVKVSAANSNLIKKLIEHASALPETLQRRVMACYQALGLSDSAFMKSTGIEVKSAPIELSVPVLPPPTMVYQQNVTSKFEPYLGGWRTGRVKFYKPGQVTVWAVYCVIRGSNVRFNQNDLRQFVNSYVAAGRSKGLNMGTPTEMEILDVSNRIEPTVPVLRKRLKLAKSHGCKFVLLITNKADTLVHDCLKVYEQELAIVTQNVTSEIAKASAGIGQSKPKSQTMDNIVNKTNIKIGGLNYNIESSSGVLGENDLFMGFALNRVSKMAKLSNTENTRFAPSVLGYAANDTSDSIGFAGDYIYHDYAQQGDLAAFYEATMKICERWRSNRQSLPKHVIVYCNGCSDGDLRFVRMYKVPLLRAIISKQLGPSIGLVLIVVDRLHNVNFVLSDIPPGKTREQNIPHGVVVDRKVTSPLFPEFYLISHRSQRGTTKAPRYVVVVNETKMTMTQLEEITYHLCFSYQIIATPVSLPASLYVAEQYAKRGRNLYGADANANKVLGSVACDELTNALSYKLLVERNQRVNA